MMALNLFSLQEKSMFNYVILPTFPLRSKRWEFFDKRHLLSCRGYLDTFQIWLQPTQRKDSRIFQPVQKRAHRLYVGFPLSVY